MKKKIADSVRSMNNQDGGILLDINQGLMFSLNIVGSKIVEKLQQGLEPGRIVKEISSEFGVSPIVVQQDLEEFLESLQKHALLRPDGDKKG